MGETKNIDEMAQIISDKIFSEMKWEVNNDYKDINWSCCDELHKTKTHPTDLVFNYIDPYTEITQYIQTDLKSYKKESISPSRIGNALVSLSKQVYCAKRSKEWAGFFTKQELKYNIHGMLFIYNNDDRYDKNLLQTIESKATFDFLLPKESKLNIFPPKLISFLLNVVSHIKERRNIELDESPKSVESKIADRSKCSFYYPDKHNKCSSDDLRHPASLEMITSGMILFEYLHPETNERILNIFWDEEIKNDSYFVYLFEFIFNYQMLNVFERVYVITPFSGTAANFFSVAKNLYHRQYAMTQTQKNKLAKIEMITMENVKVSLFPFPMTNKGIVRHLVKDNS